MLDWLSGLHGEAGIVTQRLPASSSYNMWTFTPIGRSVCLVATWVRPEENPVIWCHVSSGQQLFVTEVLFDTFFVFLHIWRYSENFSLANFCFGVFGFSTLDTFNCAAVKSLTVFVEWVCVTSWDFCKACVKCNFSGFLKT